ncbi:MAG: hypothetical protein WAO98_07705 [Alphaproteobacteria bacterium]
MSYEVTIRSIPGEEGLVQVSQPELLRACNALMRLSLLSTDGNLGKIIALRNIVNPQRKRDRKEHFYFQRRDIEQLNSLLENINQTAQPETFKRCMTLMLGQEMLLQPAFQAEIQRGIDQRAGKVVPVHEKVALQNWALDSFKKYARLLFGPKKPVPQAVFRAHILNGIDELLDKAEAIGRGVPVKPIPQRVSLGTHMRQAFKTCAALVSVPQPLPQCMVQARKTAIEGRLQRLQYVPRRQTFTLDKMFDLLGNAVFGETMMLQPIPVRRTPASSILPL